MFAARRCPQRQPSAAPWRTTDMATAITRRNVVKTIGASSGIGMLAASVATTIAQQTAAAASPSPTVANGVSEMPDGNLILSFRDISTVIMIDRQTGAIYWKLGAPPLAGQHAAHMLANGNVLLFDNGPHRLDHSFPFSRALEIDPATKKIVWKYQEARVAGFFSPRLSNAQRLPNGNTLINEGWFGRLFEVTRDGSVVWEYVNPYF